MTWFWIIALVVFFVVALRINPIAAILLLLPVYLLGALSIVLSNTFVM